eukprot:jgi/Tetstr1/420359/TSEL_011479.t1
MRAGSTLDPDRLAPVPSVFTPAGHATRACGRRSASTEAKMGYVRVWDDFVVAAQRLFQEQPGRVRYSMKYRHCDGKLILKVTNNSECLLYKTDQVQDLKKIEKLNNLFFALTSRGKSAGAEDLDLEMPEAQITQATVAGGQTGRKNRRRG